MGLFGKNKEYPPTADAVQAFLDRLDRLDDGQLLKLHAMWRGIPDGRREVAWSEVRRAARAQGLDWWLGEVTDKARTWGTSDPLPYLYATTLDNPHRDIVHQAAAAVVDAALAIAFEPYLSPETHKTLIGPYKAAVAQ